MKSLLITSLAVVILCGPNTLGQSPSTDKQPVAVVSALDRGQLNGLNYTNEFFGLSLQLPQQWIVTSAQRRDQIASEAKKMILAGEKSKTLQVNESIDRSTTLVALTKLPVGQPDNASFMLIAERIPSPSIKDGLDVLRALERLAKGTNFTVEFVDGIKSEQINGIDLGVATIKNTSPYGVFWQKIYVAVKNGYALQLSLTYLDRADLATLKNIVESLKIN